MTDASTLSPLELAGATTSLASRLIAAMMAEGATAEQLLEFASGDDAANIITACARNGLGYWRDHFPLITDQSMAIEVVVALAKFKYVDPRIMVPGRFRSNKQGKAPVNAVLAHSSVPRTSEEMLATVTRRDHIWLSLWDLCTAAALRPDLGDERRLVVLQHVWKDEDGVSWVPCVYGRNLMLVRLDQTWDELTDFLTATKPAA